jgi:enterochelin esterase-like enzyme
MSINKYEDATHEVNSRFLKMRKRIDIFLPPTYHQQPSHYFRLVIMNDGQDVKSLKIKENLDRLHLNQEIHPTILVAVHATQRIQEYGTAGHPDYANRGSKARSYTNFVVHELIPFLTHHYRLIKTPETTAILGFSLGGLSAFDIAWNNPHIFGRVGVCSGSFWWRRHSENDDLAQIDRIMHDIVRKGYKKEGLKFWFEAGTNDETADRNHNGIIDAIEDTLDLIAELILKGYDNQKDIKYLEVHGGEHNQRTWALVVPDFLKWAFGR